MNNYKNKEKNYTVRKGVVAGSVLASTLAVTVLIGAYIENTSNKLYNEAIGAEHTRISAENYIEGTSLFEDGLTKIGLYNPEKKVNLDDKIAPILRQYENVFELNDFNNKSGNYDKLVNNEYCYLEFYEVYDLINAGAVNSDLSNDRKLLIMDIVLKKSVEMAYSSYSDGKYDYTDAFYEDISKYSCFLEFVSDRVSNMTGMDMSKYNVAISEYLTLNREKTYRFLSESSKELIDELLEMYESETRKLRNNYDHDVNTVADYLPNFKKGGSK